MYFQDVIQEYVDQAALQPLTPVQYSDARKHIGVEFEASDVCVLTGKGGTCGV